MCIGTECELGVSTNITLSDGINIIKDQNFITYHRGARRDNCKMHDLFFSRVALCNQYTTQRAMRVIAYNCTLQTCQ